MNNAVRGRVGETLPISSVLRGLRDSWWVVALASLVCGLLAWVACMFETPVYQARSTLYVTSAVESSVQSAYQGTLASQQRIDSYAKLATSDSVLADASQRLGVGLTAEDLRPTINARPVPETVLLEVYATATDPVRAMGVANAVSGALSDAVSSLEKPSASAPPLAKVTVVTPAEANAEPVSPRILRTVLIAMFCGAVLGAIAAYVYYRSRNTVDWAEGISQVSGKPILGDIPLDDSLPAKGALDYNVGASESAEAFRKLRTNLGFINVDGSSRVILITSPSQADGKTTTAINIAAAVAESGKRVVLVDTDLRRPSVARRFGAMEGIGLTDYLRGSSSVAEVTQSVGIDGLDILASGQLPPNPAELLESDRTRECFLELAELYDYVIVDSPPILPVTDAMVAAQWADGVVVVVRAGKTRRSALDSVLTQLEAGNRTVFGVVLNGVEASRRQYRYYYGAGVAAEEAGPTRAGVPS